jgi:hypothetical protein
MGVIMLARLVPELTGAQEVTTAAIRKKLRR